VVAHHVPVAIAAARPPALAAARSSAAAAAATTATGHVPVVSSLIHVIVSRSFLVGLV